MVEKIISKMYIKYRAVLMLSCLGGLCGPL